MHSLKYLLISLTLLLTNSFFAQKVKPIFKDGEAQIVDEFKNQDDWIIHDLWVETEFDSDVDGNPDRMHVSVTRPKQTEKGLKLPIVYNTSPYFAGTGPYTTDYFWNVRHELGATPPKRVPPTEIVGGPQRPAISKRHTKDWVPRGYIVVHSCSPGTGLSDGSPTVGGDNESLAPKAVIDWLNGRAKGFDERKGGKEVKAFWSTGKVGMIGTSYNGTLPIAAATTGVEGLEAIIPIAPNTSYYHYYRSHGLIRHPGGYLGEDIDVLYDFIHSGDEAMRASNNARVRDTEMAEGMDRVTGDYNDFWKGRDYLHDMEPFKTPLLMSHGFNDWNVMPEHSYRIYKAVNEKGIPCQIYYHQGGHGGPPPMSLMNRWFTRYLHGVENNVEKDPKSWILREDVEKNEPTPYADYPHPDAENVELFLVGNSPEIGSLQMGPNDENQMETFVDNFSFSAESLAQAEYTNHRLLFISPELSKVVHISGEASIKIKLTCDKPSANLSAYLVSLPWENERAAKIYDNIITRAWADPQNHESLTKSSPLKKNEWYEMEFTFQPDDQIIPAGQKIGLMIFSSDRDFTLWPTPGTQITVDLSETVLTLPVVGGKSAFGKAISR